MASAPPTPGLAQHRVRARHKRRVVSVPATLPLPPSALRRQGPVPEPPGRARRLEHPWTLPKVPGALFEQLLNWSSLLHTYRGWGAEETWRGKVTLTWEPKARRDSAGVCHRGPWRKALVQLLTGFHFSRTGNSLCHPAPRRAPSCHRTERRKHAPLCCFCPGGSPCPPLVVRLRPHRPHPVTSAALHAFLFDTSTGYSSVSVLPPAPQPTCFCRSLCS